MLLLCDTGAGFRSASPAHIHRALLSIYTFLLFPSVGIAPALVILQRDITTTNNLTICLAMKRPCDDTSSDSDIDETIDVGSENNYSGHSSGSLIRSNSPTTTSQIMARKKRRGGSAKLEKAEILQMTVDHLKMLQATGGKGYFDAHALAMDFMSIGFRECLTEVARYLGSVEGLDSSDPLRVRLVSHLSSCASQREAVAMTSTVAPHQHSLHPHHWAAAFHHLPAALLQQNGLSSSDNMTCRLSTATELPSQHGSALLTATFAHADAALRVPAAGSVPPGVPPLSTSLLSLSATVHAAAAAAAQSFPLSFAGAFPVLPPGAAAAAMAASAATAIASPLSLTSSPRQAGGNVSSKPYRPWGTEVGAF
uniref:Hes related family bHLH transcription factor with YRPW motif 2 n=1 Tax=Xenopus tropicalis TaxID=8364 RepID=A0A803JA54_XENTR